MLLYDVDRSNSLAEFGIEIPISDTTIDNTLAHLKSHPRAGSVMGDWIVPSVNLNITKKDLCRAHTPGYIERLYTAELEKEIIATYELLNAQGRYYRYNPQYATQPLAKFLERALMKVAGTYQCCITALENNFCFYFGGGMHHAHTDYGSGFCLLNDIVIALRKLQSGQKIRHAWVIDLDAHKGDGTAEICADDPTIITLSIHMAKGWPLDDSGDLTNQGLNPAFIPSDIDIPIARNEEHRYVPRLKEGLKQLERQLPPDLSIVVSGADPYELDELPSTAELNLSLEQLLERDKFVYNFLEKRRIPRAYLMAGGYGQNTWQVYTQFLEWVLMDRLKITK